MKTKQIRNKHVQLRLNEFELASLQQRAVASALNLSDYLRFCLFDEARKLSSIEPGRAVLIAGMIELTEIATVLRQVVRQQHAGSSRTDIDLLTSTLIQLKNLSIKLINYLDHGRHGKA